VYNLFAPPGALDTHQFISATCRWARTRPSMNHSLFFYFLLPTSVLFQRVIPHPLLIAVCFFFPCRVSLDESPFSPLCFVSARPAANDDFQVGFARCPAPATDPCACPSSLAPIFFFSTPQFFHADTEHLANCLPLIPALLRLPHSPFL